MVIESAYKNVLNLSIFSYDTCNSNKNDCDYDFKDCLFDKCKLMKEKFFNQKKVGEGIHFFFV